MSAKKARERKRIDRGRKVRLYGKGGISTMGAIVATIGGLFLVAGIVALFGDGENTPVIITMLLWIICGAGLSVWFDEVEF